MGILRSQQNEIVSGAGRMPASYDFRVDLDARSAVTDFADGFARRIMDSAMPDCGATEPLQPEPKIAVMNRPKWAQLIHEDRFDELAEILTALTLRDDPAVNKWSVCLLDHGTYHGKAFGHAFYDALRKHVGSENFHEWFEANILPRLPAEWKTNYLRKIPKTRARAPRDSRVPDENIIDKRRVPRLRFCPFDWRKLVGEGRYEDIAAILMSFERLGDTLSHRWGLGSLAKWTCNGRLWGLSFYNALHNDISPEDPENWFYTHIVKTEALRPIGENYKRMEWCSYVRDDITEQDKVCATEIGRETDRNERRTKLLQEAKENGNRRAYLSLVDDLMDEDTSEPELNVRNYKRVAISKNAWYFDDLGIKDWGEAVKTWMRFTKIKKRVLSSSDFKSGRHVGMDEYVEKHKVAHVYGNDIREVPVRLVFGDIFGCIHRSFDDAEMRALFAHYLFRDFPLNDGVIDDEFGVSGDMSDRLKTLPSAQMAMFEQTKTAIREEMEC